MTVPVTDQERALKFYTTKLGFRVKVDVPCPEWPQRWIAMVMPCSSIELVLFTGQDFEEMVGKHMNVMFATNDIEKTYKSLVAHGVEVLAPPKREFWGSYITIKDSEGNMFCVGQDHAKKNKMRCQLSRFFNVFRRCWAGCQ